MNGTALVLSFAFCTIEGGNGARYDFGDGLRCWLIGVVFGAADNLLFFCGVGESYFRLTFKFSDCLLITFGLLNFGKSLEKLAKKR